jgi:hypothetical protein
MTAASLFIVPPRDLQALLPCKVANKCHSAGAQTKSSLCTVNLRSFSCFYTALLTHLRNNYLVETGKFVSKKINYVVVFGL